VQAEQDLFYMIKLVRTYIFFTLQKSSRTHFNLSKNIKLA